MTVAWESKLSQNVNIYNVKKNHQKVINKSLEKDEEEKRREKNR